MQPFQQRVVDEKRELDAKLASLREFIDRSPKFHEVDESERERLERQASLMRRYSEVLGERIGAFNG